MAFDSVEYQKRVLMPYMKGAKQGVLRDAVRVLKRGGSRVPDSFDLAEFYDIGSATSDTDMSAQIEAVGLAINAAVNKAMRMGGNTLPRDFHELVLEKYPEARTASFWAGELAKRHGREMKASADLAENIAAEFRALGVITMSELEDLAKGSGISNSALLIGVLRDVGVAVVPDFPAVAMAAPAITSDLAKTSHHSVVGIIFFDEPDAYKPFTLLSGFSAPRPTLRLSLATVAAAKAATGRHNNINDNEIVAIEKILGSLESGVRTDQELWEVVVAHFVKLAAAMLREVGTKRGAKAVLAERTGLDPIDAARLVAHAAGDVKAVTWSDVQALITSGSVREARRLYDSLSVDTVGSPSNEQKKVVAALDGAERRIADLHQRAQAAQTQGDLEAAARALAEALAICSDDEALASAARALPPAAPVRFVASLSEDARTTRLSWEPGFGSTEDTRYQVVRKVGAPPLNGADGTSLGNTIRTTSVHDPNPPIAVKTFYGVSASHGGPASPVTVAEVMALPPVTDVVVTSDPSSVTLRWTTPPEASVIEVVQIAPDGSTRALQAGTQSGTTSTGLWLGATYTYLLTALYAGAAGERLRSATTRVTGIPRGVAEPVATISVSASNTAGEKPEVTAEWSPVEGYAVEVWHFSQRPNWPLGARLPMAEITRRGARLAGRSLTTERHEGVQGATEPGMRVYVAITRDGEFGLVGAMQPYGVVPPIRNVSAERFGDEAVLSWDWPGSEYRVRVRWTGDQSGERIVSKNQYHAEGGCRISVGGNGCVAEVASLSGDGDAEWTSPSTAVAIPGAAVAIAYDVVFQRRLLGPLSGAALTFSVPPAVNPIEIVVVGHFSRYMPFDSSQGSVLARTTVSAAAPRVDVAVPRGGRGPVWVRAFAVTPDVRLLDPSPARMKVD